MVEVRVKVRDPQTNVTCLLHAAVLSRPAPRRYGLRADRFHYADGGALGRGGGGEAGRLRESPPRVGQTRLSKLSALRVPPPSNVAAYKGDCGIGARHRRTHLIIDGLVGDIGGGGLAGLRLGVVLILIVVGSVTFAHRDKGRVQGGRVLRETRATRYRQYHRTGGGGAIDVAAGVSRPSVCVSCWSTDRSVLVGLCVCVWSVGWMQTVWTAGQVPYALVIYSPARESRDGDARPREVSGGENRFGSLWPMIRCNFYFYFGQDFLRRTGPYMPVKALQSRRHDPPTHTHTHTPTANPTGNFTI